MALFGLRILAADSREKQKEDAVAFYERIARQRFRLNECLVHLLPKTILERGAKRLGLLHGGSIGLDDDCQLAVLMDYCIYDVFHQGRNTIENYLCEFADHHDADEVRLLRAMEQARYSLIAVRRVEVGVGCEIHDLFSGIPRLLIDFGLSRTAKPGLVIATRLFDFGDFITTAGAPLPVGILNEETLSDWIDRFRDGRDDDTYDPAPLIRRLLHDAESPKVDYIDSGEEDTFLDPSAPTGVTDSPQRRLDRPRPPNINVARTRRCRCGSGKMFKNCCGRR